MKYASLEISFQRLCWVSPTIFTRQFARWITFTLQRTPPRPSFFESPPWRNGKVRSLIFDISFQSVLTFNPNHFYSSFFWIENIRIFASSQASSNQWSNLALLQVPMTSRINARSNCVLFFQRIGLDATNGGGLMGESDVFFPLGSFGYMFEDGSIWSIEVWKLSISLPSTPPLGVD